MNKRIYVILFLVFTITLNCNAQKSLKLWYNKQATEWNEALPLGNGRLGAMVHGGVDNEIITLNEESLWSGYPKDGNQTDIAKYIPMARKAIEEGDYEKGDYYTAKLQGAFTQSYAPMGTLTLDFDDKSEVSEYYRDLNLQNAIAKVNYKRGKVQYKREMFVSYPDQAIVIKLTANKKGKLSFKAILNSKLKHKVKAEEGSKIILTGKCPKHVDPNYMGETENPVIYDDFDGEGINFSTQLLIQNKGGKVYAEDGYLHVKEADEVTIFVTAGSSFNGFNKSPGMDGKDAEAIANNHLFQLKDKSYSEIKKDHISDYQKYFNRVSLSLSENKNDLTTTVDRILNYDSTKPDTHLDELLFQYGRYLLISSSRTGGIPANLQGIWSHKVRPPWSDNFTSNINVQMNYWPAEITNLSEMHEPLLRFVNDLSANGANTAESFGMEGWCVNHNTDIWALTNPVGGYGWGGSGATNWCNFSFGGAWFCQHLFEHFKFSNDTTFLKEQAYPLMKGAAKFISSWLYEGPDGTLVSGPSSSPENSFYINDKRLNTQLASAMDMSLANELYSNCIKSAEILKTDIDLIELWTNKKDKLTPLKIGKYGQIQEWYYDWDNPENKHRHLSHLYALYPGNKISPSLTPKLAKACKQTLEQRGDGGPGWSVAWKVNLWARLLDGNRAHQLISNIYKYVDPSNYNMGEQGGVYPNLLGACPPFMIDGSFGVTAGIAEMLLQSHSGEIHLLPALPDAWNSGEVKGLVARGGYVVDISWKNGQLTKAILHSKKDGNVTVKHGSIESTVYLKASEKYEYKMPK